MTHKYFLTVLLISTFFSAIFAQSLPDFLKKNNIQAVKSEEGIFYTMNKEGKGKNIATGEYALIQFKGQLLTGEVFDASAPDAPFIFQVGQRQVIRGLDKAISLLKAGGQASIFFAPEWAFGKTGAGIIPPNAPVKFDIELLKIMTEVEYENYIIQLEEKERKAFAAKQVEQFKQDKKDIHYYASQKQLKTKTLDSGLSYSITSNGKGANAKKGDKLRVTYQGFLLNDTQFDASAKEKPYEFILGEKKVIEGWEEGLQYFNEGSSGWLLVPSKLAYGARGIKENNINIPSYSVLIFKVKVEKIERPKK